MKYCLWSTATATKLHIAHSILNFNFILKWFSGVIFLSIFFSNYHSLVSLPVYYYCQNTKCSYKLKMQKSFTGKANFK